MMQGQQEDAAVQRAAALLHAQGVAALRAGRPAEAAGFIERAIAQGGESADALCNLGAARRAAGDKTGALAAFDRALALAPRHLLALGNRGNLLAQTGAFAAAADSYRAALALAPDNAGLCNNLGNVLRQSGDLVAALAAYGRALALAPDYVEALANLGSLQTSMGELEEAATSLERAAELRPRDAATLINLGRVRSYRGEHAAAETCYRAAVALAPDLAVAQAGLGDVLFDLGRADEAVARYGEALRLKPNDPAALSAMLFLRNYQHDATAAELSAMARRFGLLIGDAAGRPPGHDNVPDPHRRLRVGFVSGDFRRHPVAKFLTGVLPHLRSGGLELFAYATSVIRDDATETIAGAVDHWGAAAELDDAAFAARIRSDRIDVLVDLSGHTKFNRLPVFARRPAPVQASWLGYSGTTGIEAIDYLIGDRWVTPEAEATHLVETAWRLPQSYLCFTPPADVAPVGAPPAASGAPLTFGCFNTPSKISDATVGVWATLLTALPHSRLLLKHRLFDEAAVSAAFRARFAAAGLASERLLFRGGDVELADHLRAYDQIDMALDPFPYNGTTTTVEALWMGVPVLVLKGERFIAHVGESILGTLGLTAWVGEDAADYVARAVRFATDIDGLVALRASLRPRLLASPLCDAPAFAASLEAALRAMWQRWCAQRQ